MFRLHLLLQSIIYEAKNEVAFRGMFFASLASTMMYSITYLVFIEVIFTNTKTIGSYDRDEVMFFYFISQIMAYITFSFNKSATALIDDINNGGLDFSLLRPIPSLFYANIRKINIISFIRDGIPPLIVIALAIKWSELDLSTLLLIQGSILFVIGMWIINNLGMIAATVTFWFGQGKAVQGFIHEFSFDANAIVPTDAMPKILQNIFIKIIPIIFAAGASTAVMLGKMTFGDVIPYAILGVLYFEFMKQILWKWGLKSYTSASS